MPSHAPLIFAAALLKSKCVGGGMGGSGCFVLMLSRAKVHVYLRLPLGDRRFKREKARARLHMQSKVGLLHVIRIFTCSSGRLLTGMQEKLYRLAVVEYA